MSDINFNCPHCSRSLAVDMASAGTTVVCPQCGQTILVPQLARTAQPSRGRGWWLVFLGVFAILLLVTGLLLWPGPGQKQTHENPGTTSVGMGVPAPVPVLPSNLASNLVLYFNFDSEPPAGKVPDLSGHGNTGQAVNVQWIADGHDGGALSLSPNDSHIRVPNNDSLNPPQFTLYAWIKTSRTDRYWRRIFDKGLFHGEFALSVAGDWGHWNPPSKYRGFIEFEMMKSGETTSRRSLADGQWHQIAATYDGEDKRLFVDGQLEATTHCPDISLGNDLDLVIGGFTDLDSQNDNPHASFDGSLDDVMMFNRALSPDEIAVLYKSPKIVVNADNGQAAHPIVHSVVNATNGTATVDFNTTTVMGTPYVFGGTGYPQKSQQDDIYPKLLDAGITSIRGDFNLEDIIPSRLCASVDDYNNNVNNIQDPTNWDFGHLYWIDAAKRNGLRTMLQVDYCPPWLSCNGKKHGVPGDWSVWEDIVRKVYARYRSKTDWIETWNEPDWGLFDISGSPYASKEDALVDIWYHTENAIRSVNPKAMTGGFALAWEDTTAMDSIVSKAIAKYGSAWANTNLNFISWHEYAASPGATDPGAMRGLLAGWGLDPDKPIFIDEWNHLSWDPRQEVSQATEEIGFVGRALTKFINSGVGANYFSLYPYNDFMAKAGSEDKQQYNRLDSFYIANPDGRTGKLLLRSWPYRVLSNQLGLGKGYYAVKQITGEQGIDACAAVNSEGQKVVFIANYHGQSNAATITLKGLSGNAARIVEYWAANPDNRACVTNTITVSNGTGVYSMNMNAQTCVGLIVKDNG